jgi:hypothetical protein
MHLTRALAVALGALALAIAAMTLRSHGPAGWLPACTFHHFTGLLCPGCGMTRASFAALHGRLGQAFRCNPVGMVLLPLALTGLALEVCGWVRAKPLPVRLSLGARGGWFIAWTILAFWFLRNLPWWPFTLLAPP